MRDTIVDIREHLQRGSYSSERAISQAIVLRILHDLSWPTFNPTVVWPEFSLQGTRVDYALCHPPQKPLVLVEVKQVNTGVGAEQQLFGYAVHHGVPLAILTTGQVWQFFLPGERGDYEERRVYLLDLVERDPDECVSRLVRYLDYRRVCSGEAIEAARTDYQDATREREMKRTLPEAWIKLIREGDDLLLELLAEKVESLCGYKPSSEMVAKFLGGQGNRVPSQTEVNRPAIRQQERTQPTPPVRVEPRAGQQGFMFQGTFHATRSMRDAMLEILRLITMQDPTFPERLEIRMQGERGRRGHISRSVLALYPGNPDLAQDPNNWRELYPGSGWWIDVNKSRGSMTNLIRSACEVAGLTYGEDVEMRFG